MAVTPSIARSLSRRLLFELHIVPTLAYFHDNVHFSECAESYADLMVTEFISVALPPAAQLAQPYVVAGAG
jgi:hypothetical protein